MAESEEWRPTHNPKYEVSNLGRVRSWAKLHPAHKPLTTPRVLKGSINRFGYPSVGFWPEVKRYTIHSLVAAAFIGPRPVGYHVMHKDDNPANPRLDNLEYGTPLQNVQQTLARGRQPRRKFTEAQVRELRQEVAAISRTGPANRLPNGTAKRLAQRCGVSERCIEAAIWGVNYSHA